MKENISRYMAITSLITGSIVYVITLVASTMLLSGMIDHIGDNDPEEIGNAAQKYFELMKQFELPIFVLCSIGIGTGLLGLRATGRYKGMAVAGLIMGILYMIIQLFLLKFYANLL